MDPYESRSGVSAKDFQFYDAVTAGDLEEVKRLFADPEVNLNMAISRNERRYWVTPFINAARLGHVEIVKYFLAFKDPHRTIDLNSHDEPMDKPPTFNASKSSRGLSALKWACKNNHHLVVKILLDDPRITIESTNHRPFFPVHNAFSWDHADLMNVFINSSRSSEIFALHFGEKANTAREEMISAVKKREKDGRPFSYSH